ncbi:hypothetical protein E2C01_088833 [Portunus trituberculatus]|uniref:Uncharacterized protein n=1 Tax=Portunus trituberculatus TaxID=210409 RepID=A0A5B7JH51_PORTR|nr:hypothetical protein [Portunus trituberculatus]
MVVVVVVVEVHGAARRRLAEVVVSWSFGRNGFHLRLFPLNMVVGKDWPLLW